MPVRSSSSHVLVWPKKSEVIETLTAWAETERENRPDVIRIGIFGSLLRDDWGVGSDADLVVIVARSERAPAERPVEFQWP